MNQLKTARLHISLRKTLLALAAGLVIFASQAAAQKSLGDLVSEAGFDWMIGKWVTETEDGQKYEIVYKWELNKHAITVQLKRGDYEHHSMIFYIASENKIAEIGADNKGGTSKGAWEFVGDKATHKMEHTPANGETARTAFIYSKTEAGTMMVKAYMLDSEGKIGDESWGTLEYTRQKERAEQTDKT